MEWVGFSRKDFNKPLEQKFPHRSFEEEVAYASTYFPEGHGYVLGPLSRDHWAVFVADDCEEDAPPATDRTLNVRRVHAWRT